MGLWTVPVINLGRILLVESLLVVLLNRRFDVFDRDGLLRTRLVYGNGVGPVLLECRLLGKRVSLRWGKIVDRR